MTCEDCIHIDVCKNLIGGWKTLCCEDFKDRSRFVELPCVAGEYVYVIEPIFGKSIEHTISRRKIKSIEPHAEIKFYGGWIHDYLSGFGRYIFSTYEEAEQALKEREENETDN
jgi:hypothetical protein